MKTLLVQGKDRKYTIDIEREAKYLTKAKGRKIKDIARIELHPMDYGISLSVWDTNNHMITNCAC